MKNKLLIFASILVLIIVFNIKFSFSACSGCEYNGKCYSVGNELQVNEIPSYCDLQGEIREQKQDDENCQNNFECINNFCSYGKCVNKYKEVIERKEIIKNITESVKTVGPASNCSINITISSICVCDGLLKASGMCCDYGYSPTVCKYLRGTYMYLASLKDHYSPVELTDPKQASFFDFFRKSTGNAVNEVSVSSKKNIERYVFQRSEEKIKISKERVGLLGVIFTRGGLRDVYEKKMGEEKITFSINQKDIKITKIENYDFIKINGLDYSASSPGDPEVPTKSFKIELPKNSKVESIGLISGSYLELSGIIKLAPRREPIEWAEDVELGHSTEIKPLWENESVYSLEEFYPGEVIGYSEGEDNENKYVYVRVNPLQYLPSENKTIIILNAEIAVQYSISSPAGITGQAVADIDSEGIENVILYSTGYEEAAGMLKNFHNAEGIKTEIINVNEITDEEAEDSPYTSCIKGGSGYSCSSLISNGYNAGLARRIISFLRDKVSLKYVTIIGEAKKVPPSDYINTGEQPPTDFWYSSPDYDLTPNYAVGRLPAKTPAEAVHMVNKTIKWKENLGSWFNNSVVCGGNAFHGGVYIGEFITDGAIDMGYFDGFNIEKKFQSEGKFTLDEIEPILKEGNYGIFYHIGHGSGDSADVGNGYLSGSIVENYPENLNIPVLVSIACSNGKWDNEIVLENYDNSFAESSLLSRAGSVAYIGGSRTNYGGVPAYLENGLLNMTVDQPFMQGMLDYVFQAYAEGKDSLGDITKRASEIYNENKYVDGDSIDKLTFFAFVLLGDPALQIPAKPSLNLAEMPRQEAIDANSFFSAAGDLNAQGTIPYFQDNVKINIFSSSPILKFRTIGLGSNYYLEEDLNVDNSIVKEFSKPDSLLWLKAENQDSKKQSWFYLSTRPPKPDVSIQFDYSLFETNKIEGQENEIIIRVSNYGNKITEDVNLSFYVENNLIASEIINEIGIGDTRQVIFNWIPNDEGIFLLKAEANLSEDSNFYNNIVEENLKVVGKSMIRNDESSAISGYLLLEILKDEREAGIPSSSGGGGGSSSPITSYGEKKLYRIYFADEEEEFKLLSRDLDIAAYKKGEFADVVADERETEKLKGYGFSLKYVYVNNENLFKTSFSDFGYHRYEDIEPELRALEAENPSIAKVYSIGKSIEGRDIWAIKISDNVASNENEPAVMIDGDHHAREIITVEIPIYFASYLVKNYSLPRVKSLVDSREFWIIPTVNPDGLVYVEQDIYWRKNRRDNGDGSFGVDLNRNYGYRWGFNDYGSSPYPWSDSYRGSSAFSEPETQAIKNLSEKQNFSLQISYHSYGNHILYPWSYKYKLTGDNADFETISQELVNSRGLANYNYGIPPEIIYEANGASFDWDYGERNTKAASYGFAFEVGDWNDGFRPAVERILPLEQEQLEPLLYLSEQVPNWQYPADIPPPAIYNYRVVLNDSTNTNLRTIASKHYLTLDTLFGQQQISEPGEYELHGALLDAQGNVISNLESSYNITIY